MKALTLTLSFILIAFQFLGAQSEIKSTSTFTLNHEVIVYDYDFIENQKKITPFILHPEIVFEIIDSRNIGDEEYSVIKTKEKIKSKKRDQHSIETRKIELNAYYILKSSKLENNTTSYLPRTVDLVIGLAVIPVKLFPGNSKNRSLDFTASSISQGASIGLTHQVSKKKSDLWITYSFSMNFTKVTPRIDDFANDTYEGNDLAALSPAFGCSLNYNNAELGIFIGRDYLSGTAATDWNLNGKTWFSIVIGKSFDNKSNI